MLKTLSMRVPTSLIALHAPGLVSTGLPTLSMQHACDAQGRKLAVERIGLFGLSKSFSCRDLD